MRLLLLTGICALAGILNMEPEGSRVPKIISTCPEGVSTENKIDLLFPIRYIGPWQDSISLSCHGFDTTRFVSAKDYVNVSGKTDSLGIWIDTSQRMTSL